MPDSPVLGPTLEGVAWSLVIAVAASALVAVASTRRGSDRTRTVNRVLTVWLLAALCAVVYLTLQPGPEGFAGARPSIFNPVSKLDGRDAVANALLYVPVGLFAALLWRSSRQMVTWATALAFAVSFTIEFSQWVLPIDRAATAHDVIFNTLGGFVGALVATVLVRVWRGSRRSKPSRSG